MYDLMSEDDRPGVTPEDVAKLARTYARAGHA
jgi:hypothetical protein